VGSSDLILILGDAATEGGRGENWKCRIKQELERLGMGDIWENGRNNNKSLDKNKEIVY
jgi:hypothetical protein